MMLNSDVRNQLKSASESAKIEMQKMHKSGDFSRLSTRVSAIENTQLESEEKINEQLESVDAHVVEQKILLSRFNSTLASLALANVGIKSRILASDEIVTKPRVQIRQKDFILMAENRTETENFRPEPKIFRFSDLL